MGFSVDQCISSGLSGLVQERVDNELGQCGWLVIIQVNRLLARVWRNQCILGDIHSWRRTVMFLSKGGSDCCMQIPRCVRSSPSCLVNMCRTFGDMFRATCYWILPVLVFLGDKMLRTAG
jgi:hypothetical protein